MRNLIFLPTLLFFFFLSACAPSDSTDQPQAENATITELSFANTPEKIESETTAALARADEQLAEILAANPQTFENTIVAVDALLALGERTANKYRLLAAVAPDSMIREAANISYLTFAQWYFEFIGNNKLHAAVVTFKETSPHLGGEDLILMQTVEALMKEGGQGLDDAARLELSTASLTAQYYNIFIQKNVITEEEPRSYNVYWLEELINLRAKMARLLDFETWSDYRTERLMAGSEESAVTFLQDLSKDLDDRMDEQTQLLLGQKRHETGSEATSLSLNEALDYEKMYMAEAFDIEDPTKAKVFSYQQSLNILFKIAKEVFAIEILPQTPSGTTWQEDVSYYVARDVATGKALGSFYLDPYQRPGKDGWPRIATITTGLTSVNGSRDLPVLAFILDFPQPGDDTPLSMNYQDLHALFHEFGHLLQLISGSSRYHGTSPSKTYPDYMEIFSQLLEQWLTDPTVLTEITATDPTTDAPFSLEYLEDLVAANQFFAPIATRYQIAIAMTDLRLHSDYGESDAIDSVQVYNDALVEFSFPYPENVDYISPLPHMTYSGYDSRYYSYQWSQAIAIDLAAAFKNSPQGFWDAATGLRVRHELFDLTAQRAPEESITAFLGREWNTDAYLEQLGAR